MVTNADILKKIEAQNRRILAIEQEVGLRNEPTKSVEPEEEKAETKKVHKKSNLTFNQVITFLGILGIVIGIISFFFYAVANNWIGKTGQVYIGVFVGFLLLITGVMLRKNKESWSNIIIGGSYFIEYLAVGIGVLSFEVMPGTIGLALTLAFLISSATLSIYYKSKIISYFALFGGYIIPFITGYHDSHLFVMAYYSILSIGIIVISYFHNWYDLRLTSYAAVALFILNSTQVFSEFTPKVAPVIFLGIIFLIYNSSSLLSVLRRKIDHLPAIDNIILVSLPILILHTLYQMFDWVIEIFGIFVILFSFIYLLEIFIFKHRDQKVSASVIYSTVSTGIVLLNLGILAILDSLNDDYFMVLFMIEFILFGILALKVPDNKMYNAFSKLALGFASLWYVYVVRFNLGWVHALAFTLIILTFVGACFWLAKRNPKDKFNSATFAISGFLFIYSLHKFLWFIGISDIIGQIILSVLWLIYTLILYSKVEKSGRIFVWLLLAITLLKIAFRDLLFLTGVFRIVGFIIFGILLIVGGYLIKHEH